ncbi:hypothetical protein Ais01nite_02920 [Asanoa ishikariensis]|nr:hypothetical protein Ais01nite_02920 [Asanoa ishikariensis]
MYTRLVRRMLSVIAVAVAALSLTSTTANASPPEAYTACQDFGYADPAQAIFACNFIDWVPGPSMNTIQHSGTIQFGPNATSATGCKVTAYVTINFSSTWKTPKVTRDCTKALENRYSTLNIWFWGGQTSGSSGVGQMCIDLYYNHSSSSGWQRCRQTGVSYL